MNYEIHFCDLTVKVHYTLDRIILNVEYFRYLTKLVFN